MNKEFPGFLTVIFGLSVGAFCSAYMDKNSEVKSKYSMIGKQIFGSEQKEPNYQAKSLGDIAINYNLRTIELVNQRKSSETIEEEKQQVDLKNVEEDNALQELSDMTVIKKIEV